jgi:hypothetical protein
MTEKIQIKTLPITEQFMRQKRLIQDRGELALIEDGTEFQHLGYFSLRKGKGYYRGGHYHRRKVEHFYMVSGRIRVQLVDLGGAARYYPSKLRPSLQSRGRSSGDRILQLNVRP